MENPRKNLNLIGLENPSHLYTVPTYIDKHLEFIEVSTNNELLLGSSNLNGCYWKGSIWYFLEPELAPQRDKVYSGLRCDSGICDGKFLSENKVIIGEDLGSVSIVFLNKNNKPNSNADEQSRFYVEDSRSEHDNAVLSVSVSQDKCRAVTGSMDKCIKVWDVSSQSSLISLHTYRPVHKDPVTSVCMKPSCPNGNIFASCSLDGSVLLLDTRMPKPAQVIHEDIAIGFKSVDWMNDSDIIIGSTMGDLSQIDTRNRSLLSQTNISSRPIHRIVVHKNLLAVCADDNFVRVLDMNKSPTGVSNNDNNNDDSKNRIIYTDSRHKDYVRGLAWVPESDTLVSCGWDKNVFSHNLQALISQKN